MTVGRTGLEGRPTLRRLIAVSEERFAAEFWGSSPLLTRRSEQDRGLDDLFSPEDADEILSMRGLRTPFIRVAKDGVIVDSSRFTGPGGVGAAVGDQVLDERILDLFAAGHTIVLQALHRFWPPLIALAGTLSAELGHPVQINAYITPQQSQGFAAHYDVHDVFVLQIAGSKRWIIHDPVHPDPLRDQPWTQHRSAVESRARTAPRSESVLEAGDVLYLPRGFIHSAEALGGVSVHLTVGIHNHTRHDLTRALLELAADDPRLRRTLPMGVDVRDPDQLETDLASTVEALTELIGEISPAAVARMMERRDRGSNRPSPLRPLAQARALDMIAADTRVRLRPEQRVRLSADGTDVALTHSGGTLSFGRDYAEALRAVVDSDAEIRIGAIPGLTHWQRLELVKRLLRAGILVADQSPSCER